MMVVRRKFSNAALEKLGKSMAKLFETE